jgi:hypothetical protein
MRDTHGVGLVSHTAVLNRLVELGFEVLLPWASHLGYDLAYYLVEEHRNLGSLSIVKHALYVSR